MNCRKTYQLFDYLEQKLNPEDRMLMEKHLESCSVCSQSFEVLKKSMEIIEVQKDIKTNPFLFSRIEARMELKFRKRERLYKKVLQPAFVCTIVLLSILGGYFLTGKFQNYNTTTSSQEYQEYVFQEANEMALLNE